MLLLLGANHYELGIRNYELKISFLLSVFS